MHQSLNIFNMSPLEILVYFIIVLTVIVLLLKVMKKLIYNTVLGLLLLFILNNTIFANDPIPIKIWTIVITAIFGILGAVLLAIANYLGFI